jgi:ssDNA-binding Zn-finger/Zn-ribbon topoisomerase 1
MEELRPLIRKVGYGQCKECGHSLSVIESETTEYDLNDQGIPINYFVMFDSTTAVCNNCGWSMSVKKSGFGYVPDCKILNHLENERKNKQLVLINENNPFVKDITESVRDSNDSFIKAIKSILGEDAKIYEF